jgi:hypothetical protein
MCYIVPLTIFGDGGAAAARRLMTSADYHPTVLIRFFIGNVLFSGVDQATAILVVKRNGNEKDVLVGGRFDVDDARQSQHLQPAARVLHSTPKSEGWTAPWLVTTEAVAGRVWEQAVKNQGGFLRQLWEGLLQPREGDVRADYLNPLRLGANHQPQAGDVAIYKGESVHRFAPLPRVPSDWARLRSEGLSGQTGTVNRELQRLLTLPQSEHGISLREIARLNTRETLIATWFERDAKRPLAFTHELWRFRLNEGASEQRAKALLGVLNSRITAYLLNLFSTNNHVMLGELGRLLIPDVKKFPESELAMLTDTLLGIREQLERNYVEALGATLPDRDDAGMVTLSPELVLKQSGLPTIQLQNYQQRGIVCVPEGSHRVRTLLDRNRLEMTGSDAVAETVRLFLSQHREQNWLDQAHLNLPEPTAAAQFLQIHRDKQQAAQELWDNFIARQREVDEVVAKWYGFDADMRAAIRHGLPWARRRMENV